MYKGKARVKFERRLNDLNTQLIEMGELVSDSIENAIEALIENNMELAEAVHEGDIEINKKENEIESLALNILLTEKPVATDFRFVTTILKMITDLERIGDQAADISYLILKLNKRTYTREDLGSIIEMSKITVSMVEDVIQAYIDGDVSLALDVIDRDDKVDDYFITVRNEVIEDIKDEQFETKNSLDIFLIAKYLERIGDHAENLAEKVHYAITAKNIENK